LQAQREAEGYQAVQKRKEVDFFDFGFEILQQLEKPLYGAHAMVVIV
jgi:hypothetical protein